jgi:aquaporin NIP
MAGAELANGGLHESTVAMEEGRVGDEACRERSEQDGAGCRPMFSVPFVQKVCFLLPRWFCFLKVS